MTNRPASSAAWTPSEGLLEELAMWLNLDDAYESTCWFDTVDKQLCHLVFDPELDGSDPTGGDPEQQALAERILQDPERYRRVETEGSPPRLHEFIRSVDDPELREALHDARQGGRGAYRRVRDVLNDRGLEDLWHDFQRRADLELARDWLASRGLIDDPDDESMD